MYFILRKPVSWAGWHQKISGRLYKEDPKQKRPTVYTISRFYSYGVPKGRVILRVYNLSSLFYWDKSITLPPKKSTK